MQKLKFIIVSFLIASSTIVFAQPIVGLNVGNLAPDLKYKSPDGKEYTLSQLKGKMVLIDFWASWCGPCRMENPNIVNAYKKYKDKKFKTADGFTIYSISMDKNAVSWTDAIKKDNLTWEYHVSDLGGWDSKPAFEYRVRSIPTSFLIDGHGVIVAKSPRGSKLDFALQQQLYVDPIVETKAKLEELKKQVDLLKSSDDYKNETKKIQKLEEYIEKLKTELDKFK